MHASEKYTERVQKLRAEYWTTIGSVNLEDLIFIDEAGVNIAMTRRFARSPIANLQLRIGLTLDKNFKIASSQTVYVPVYSHIYHYNRQEVFELAVTLSIRNTDLTNPIVITSVRYYNSEGKLVKQYLEHPIQLDALASTAFFVNRNDTSGGLGANFIVEWVAQTEISESVVEAVMIGTDFQQGISFVSPGKVIKNQNNNQRSPLK